ncbi:hypothetical protein MMC24_003217 [Lignoscripta atroalba]|nr:hypothetical protein [Lignoscripta atroalba]
MLRRAPTAITLTSDDIAAYEDSRLARLARNRPENNSDPTQTQSVNGEHSSHGNKQTVVDPNDELKPLPGEKARVVRSGLSRDERIGLGR